MTPLRINSLTSLLLRLSAKICIFADVEKGLQGGAAECQLNVPGFFTIGARTTREFIIIYVLWLQVTYF